MENHLELSSAGAQIPPTVSISTYFGDDYIKAIGDKIASLNTKDRIELRQYLKYILGNKFQPCDIDE